MEGQNLRVQSLYSSTEITSLKELPLSENTPTSGVPAVESSDVSLTIDHVSSELQKSADSQQGIARNIFLWIAWNIEYDREAFNNKEIISYAPEAVLSNGKSLCVGFAKLFTALCIESGIESRTIQGFAKGSTSEASQIFDEPNHAWNSVKIDGNWYLADVSWASTIRSQIETEHELQQEVANKYLLQFYKTVPEEFILTHLPEDPLWQLTSTSISLEEFQKDENSITQLVKSNSDNNLAAHANAIDHYENLDSLNRVIAYMERMVDIPSNTEREYGLGIAYYYKAQELIKELNTCKSSDSRRIRRGIHYYYQKSLEELAKVDPQNPQYDFAMLIHENIHHKLNSNQVGPVF